MVFAVSSNNFCQRQLSTVAPLQLQTPTDFAFSDRHNSNVIAKPSSPNNEFNDGHLQTNWISFLSKMLPSPPAAGVFKLMKFKHSSGFRVDQ